MREHRADGGLAASVQARSSAARPSPSRSARRPASRCPPTGRPGGRRRTARTRGRIEAGDAAARADAKVAHQVAGEDPRGDDEREGRRDDRAPQHAPAARRGSPRPLRRCASPPPPTFSTSAQATPSGYGRSDCVTSARRSGIEYITPRMPPSAQIANEIQYGKPVHQPIMTRPGSTKMIEESVPAAEATVCTMLFSWIVVPRNARSTRHRDDRGRYRGGKGQPRLEPEVDVGRGEHQRDQTPEDQRRVRSARPAIRSYRSSPVTSPTTPGASRMLADITTAPPAACWQRR